MGSLKSTILNLLRTRPRPKGRVQIGEFSTGTPIIESYHRNDLVTIGKFSMLASDVMLIVGRGNKPSLGNVTRRVANYKVTSFAKKDKVCNRTDTEPEGFIKIGNDVWIGARAIILSNVSIGDGAVVGAGAVVTHDVPPYAVVAGVPAKIIRFRLSEPQIKKLRQIAWWNWNKEKIAANTDYLRGDPEAFIEKFSARARLTRGATNASRYNN